MSISRIITTLSNEDYHAHGAISKSGLDLIARTPAHYHAEKISQDESVKREATKTLNVGTAFHLLTLEPEKFDEKVAIDADSYPTKEECGRTIKAQRQEFIDANQGKIILKQKDMDGLRERARSIRNHPAASYLLQGRGMVEPSIFATDADYGVECRIRPDWLREDGLIVDLKTTRDASDSGFDKSIWNYRYHVQAALYMDMYEKATGKESVGFALVPVENSAPFLPGRPVLITKSSDWYYLGRKTYLNNLETYAHCLKTDEWPGYGDDVRESAPPAWAVNL